MDLALYERRHDLSRKTRDTHRALASLQEELSAVDRYAQRADACRDAELRAVLQHHMREEKQHAILLIAWLEKHDDDFAQLYRLRYAGDQPVAPPDKSTRETQTLAIDRQFTIGPLKS